MTRPHPRARLRRSNQIEFAAYLVLAVAVAIVVVFILLDVLDQVLPLPRILVLALGILVVLAAGVGVLALLSVRARRKIGGLRETYPDALVWWITPADSFAPALLALGGAACDRRELAEGLALVVEPDRLRLFQTERSDTRLVLDVPGSAVAEIRTERVTAGMVRRGGIVITVRDTSGNPHQLGFLGAHDVLPAYLTVNGTHDLAAEVRRSLADAVSR